VLSEVDHIIADEADPRKHPLHDLARHVLRCGGYRTAGRRAPMADQLLAKCEGLIEDAIERLVSEELASGVSWED
jgi:hypothetical protein